jgi:hypothetical protein
MKYVSRIISLLVELALLLRALFTDGTHFISLLAQSHSPLAAENLFLRKQLAFYQERKIQPQRSIPACLRTGHRAFLCQ